MCVSLLEIRTSDFYCIVHPNQSPHTIVMCIVLLPIAVVIATDYFNLLSSKIACQITKKRDRLVKLQLLQDKSLKLLIMK